VAVYEYVCAACGPFDVRLAIGTAPEQHQCPECASSARRAFSPPMLGFMPKPVGTLLDREDKSRDEPEVVTQVPARPGSRATPPVHPELSRLPRW